MSERSENRRFTRERWQQRMEEDSNRNHIWTGVILLLVGGVALAKSFGVSVPRWLFSWQMLLIVIGLLMGVKRNFRDGGWFIPIIIGGAFLINDFVLFGDLRKHVWPVIVIVIGVFFIFRPKRKHWLDCSRVDKNPTPVDGTTPGVDTPVAPVVSSAKGNFSNDDVLDSTCIFGGAKKVILSKNFKGGQMTNIFGGCEVDLTQADLTEPAIIDTTAIFGGATLIVPGNWAIKSEAVSIFGGISDKRKIPVMTEAPTKTIILKGTMIFGGMEITSY